MRRFGPAAVLLGAAGLVWALLGERGGPEPPAAARRPAPVTTPSLPVRPRPPEPHRARVLPPAEKRVPTPNPFAATVLGRVLTAAGAPARGARVQVWPLPGGARPAALRGIGAGQGAAGAAVGAARTGRDGRFRLTLPDAELSYRLRIWGGGGGQATVTFRPQEFPAVTDLGTLYLTPAATLAGVVQAPGGLPAGLQVRLHTGEVARPDERGRFRFDGLSPGRYVLTVSAPGFVAAQKSVRLFAGEEERVTVILEPGLPLAGRVVDPSHRGLAGVTVFAFPEAPAPTKKGGSWVRSGPDGHFRFSALPPGFYRVTAWRRGGAAQSLRAVAAGTQNLLLTLAQGELHVLAGEVRVRATGAPVRGARVSLYWPVGYRLALPPEAATETDRTGRFRLALPASPGGRLLVVEQAGYAPATVLLPAAPAGRVRSPLLVFLEPGAELRGSVRNEAGRAVAGAAVFLRWARKRAEAPGVLAGRSLARARTDAAGRFRFPHLARGGYLLDVRAPGYAPTTAAPVTVPRAGVVEADVRVGAGSSLELTCRYEDGTPLAGLVAFLRDRAGRAWRRTADEAGKLRFQHLPAGSFWLQVRYPIAGSGFFAPEAERIHVPPGATVQRGLTLPRPVRVLGSLRHADGSPARGWVVQLRALAGGTGLLETRTDAAGTFTFPGLLPGSYRVELLRPAARQPLLAAARVSVPRARTWRLDLTVPGGRIRGRVEGPLRRGGLVELYQLPAGLRRRRPLGPAGSFAFVALPAGRYALVLRRGGRGLAWEAPIALAPGAEVTVRLRVRPPARLEGQVVDASGRGLRRAVVRVRLAQAPRVVLGWTFSGKEGRFELAPLAAGAWLVETTLGPRRAAARTRAGPGHTAFVRLTLPGGSRR